MSSTAKDQAIAQCSAIAAMIAAYNCDFDRLEELRNDADSAPFEYVDVIKRGRESFGSDTGLTHPTDGDFNYYFDLGRELAELESLTGEYDSQDAVETAIREDALCVEYRSGWGNHGEELKPEEFRIVLCTGGPHVEIVGDIDRHGEPSRPHILYKDWGDSGELFDFDRYAILEYCGFYVMGV